MFFCLSTKIEHNSEMEWQRNDDNREQQEPCDNQRPYHVSTHSLTQRNIVILVFNAKLV